MNPTKNFQNKKSCNIKILRFNIIKFVLYFVHNLEALLKTFFLNKSLYFVVAKS